MKKLKALGAALEARPRLLAALAWTAALLLAAALYRHFAPFLAVDDAWFLDEAEAFYHGLPLRAGLDSMPLTGYYHSLLSHHLPPGWVKLFLPFAVLSMLAASFSLGAALCGRRCGALAAALAGASFLSIGALVNWGRYFETAVFTLITALMAFFLLRYRESGSTRHAVLLGLLTGASLLCRSTFFLFPFFILAALLLWRGRLRITPVAAGAIALLPYAMLAPWWLMRHLTGQEFALFETFRAKANIITGLLGYVHTIDGSYQEALRYAGLVGSENLWAWGLDQVAANPLLIVKAVLLRGWAVLVYKPVLALLALASLFAAGLDDKAKLLAAFLFYFIAVHLPMPVEARYFVPLLPLLGALIGRAAALTLWPDCAARGDGAGRAAAWVLAALVLAGPPAVYANIAHYVRNLRAADGSAVIALETASHPGDPWLLERANEARLLAHQPLETPPAQAPSSRLRFQYLLSGAIYENRFLEGAGIAPGLEKEMRALAFLHGLENGVPAGEIPGEQTLSAMLGYYPPPRALRLAGRICAADGAACAGLLPLSLRWQNAGLYRESLALLDLLLHLRPRDARLWSDKGMQELMLGRRVAATLSFRRAIDLDPQFIPAYLNLAGALGRGVAADEVFSLALNNLTPPYENLRPLLENKNP
ncbi:MAG: hypothetical protein A2X31_12565 [Elusimicrobia bacterium GWB2_63_22]|nr:MAG: hypothetical protein A2X31_12565 [Elusimicrobia bacterium GWB2_63_22]